MASGFTPSRQAADDYVRVEAFVSQYMRHPGACGFAGSSTVKINILVFGQVLDFFLQIVGLDTD